MAAWDARFVGSNPTMLFRLTGKHDMRFYDMFKHFPPFTTDMNNMDTNDNSGTPDNSNSAAPPSQPPSSPTATPPATTASAEELPKEFKAMPTLSNDERDFVRQATAVGMAMTELRIVLALARMAEMPVMDYQAKVWMNIKTGILQVLTQEQSGIITQ
ncbi:MAG: hypothetical protein H0U60_19545 [Blastocatellia bacterium]|nr:hypothetical protein [Blastocatellia bacterium]